MINNVTALVGKPLKRFLAAVSLVLCSLPSGATQMSASSKPLEVWTIQWVHTQPPDHPTREIVFTEIEGQKGTYNVHFNNGVEGTFNLTTRSAFQFLGTLDLNKSEQLPEGDTCTLKGSIEQSVIKGLWHCASAHEGHFTGTVS
jgi:hypothetical protein